MSIQQQQQQQQLPRVAESHPYRRGWAELGGPLHLAWLVWLWCMHMRVVRVQMFA